MAGFIIGAVLTVALLVASVFRNAFAAIKQHPRSWKERTVSLQIGGIKATFAEHALDVSRGGREQQFVRILRNVLNASEAAELLALAKSHPTFAEETFGNPVRSPCQVLANDNQWNTGDLADMVRTVVEERVLPYMKLVLKCHTLVASQVLVRHYHKEGRQSFSPHTDHSAFRTAVIDLTPLDKSGLFVLCGNGQDVKDASEFAFFVPLQSGDAAVHKWDVWHGVALKEGHERVSLIVWVQPAVDNDSGVCSWYLEAAVAGNAEAAYHLGIEAWRQRLLGQSKVRLLEEAQRSLRSGAFAALQQLGGKAQAEAWHWKCCKACQASAVGRSETLLRLKDLAQTQARGVLLQDLGRGMFGGKGRKRHSAEMRKAFGRGWNEAQTELPESVFEQEWTKDTGAKWTTQTLAACTFDLERAQRILERAGLAIFEDPRDRLQRVALQECQQEFQNYFSEIMVELKHRGLWPSQELDLDSECKEWFQFNEVCSRSPGRYDIQLPSESEAWAGLALEQLPWKSLVQRFLGEDAQELCRGVLLSQYGSSLQGWHRDNEHLFQRPLQPAMPAHAMTIFAPLADITTEMGFASFQPGTHVFLKPTPAAVVTPEVPFRSWLAFDNRVVHRGEANRDHDFRRDRPLLYFVYAKSWFRDQRNFPSDKPLLCKPMRTGFCTL